MRVTKKGQVTIPRNVREALGITPEAEVDFVRQDDKFYLVKTDGPTVKGKLRKLRGIASASMSTDEIMGLTRDAE